MDLGLKDKAIVIIGGANAMGYAAAEVLAEAGARVAITGRDAARSAERAAKLAQPSGAKLIGLGADAKKAGDL